MNRDRPGDEELVRFRAEAADLLGVKPSPTPSAKESSPTK